MGDDRPVRTERGPAPGPLRAAALDAPPPAASIPPPSPFRRLIVFLLLLLGTACWRNFAYILDRRPLEIAAVVVLLLLIPPVRRWAADALDRIRQPSARAADWTAVG